MTVSVRIEAMRVSCRSTVGHASCLPGRSRSWTFVCVWAALIRMRRVSTGAHDLRAATLMGLGGGLRSFAPAVALSANGRGPLAGPARFIAFGAAAGELV